MALRALDDCLHAVVGTWLIYVNCLLITASLVGLSVGVTLFTAYKEEAGIAEYSWAAHLLCGGAAGTLLLSVLGYCGAKRGGGHHMLFLYFVLNLAMLCFFLVSGTRALVMDNSDIMLDDLKHLCGHTVECPGGEPPEDLTRMGHMVLRNAERCLYVMSGILFFNAVAAFINASFKDRRAPAGGIELRQWP
mmetsp:Transcript_25167/g.70941  ORF Transcript_25167/g.70941 Transcript_25167/m.70941 type:complete len:191 (+) Transcript_25167:111-683(+)